MISNSKYFNDIYNFQQQIIKNSSDHKIVALIYNNSTITDENVKTDYKTPLFSVSGDVYEKIINYNVMNFTENYFIDLYCNSFIFIFRFKN